MAEQPANIDSEIWKDIPGWDGFQVSSLGRVRSLDRIRMQRQYGTLAPVLYKGQVKSQSRCPQTGYMKVGLSVPGRKRKTWNVNVLVCMAFHGPKPPRHEAAHWNGDRADNRLSNLRWATRKENLADRERHGTVNCGERNGGAKLTVEQVLAIREAHKAGIMPTALGKQYGLNPRHVCDIVARRRWAHVE